LTVYRHQNSPYWHYEFQMKGVRHYGSTFCTSKRDAERFERDRRTEAATGRTEKPSITLDLGFGLFWETKGRFDSAHKTTEYQMANLLRLLPAGMLLHDLDDITISAFIARRRGEPKRSQVAKPRSARKGRKAKPAAPAAPISIEYVSNASVNREVQLLRRIIRFLASRYRAPEIDWAQHKLKEQEGRAREMQPDEERALFERLRAEDNDLADLVEFAMLCGTRKDGARTLLWSKVDLKAGFAEVHTKGDVWHRFPLTQRMKMIIANRPKVGPYVFTYVCRRPAPPKMGPDGKLQPRRLAGERYPFSKQGWDRRWRRILKDAGITDFRFHDLRHTAGSRITRAGGLRTAQKILGHTRIETTARYAHVTEHDMLSAMEAADQSRNSPEALLNRAPEKRANSGGKL